MQSRCHAATRLPSPISKAKKFEQQQMERMPLLKKPLELISSDVNVPGKFWEGATINRKVFQPCAPRPGSVVERYR